MGEGAGPLRFPLRLLFAAALARLLELVQEFILLRSGRACTAIVTVAKRFGISVDVTIHDRRAYGGMGIRLHYVFFSDKEAIEPNTSFALHCHAHG